MPEPMARVYDPDTKRVTSIPERELSDSMVAAQITGIEGVVYVDRNKLRLGEVRHAELPPKLVERIKKIAAVFADVLPDPLEKWLEDFRRDDDPEPEVQVWEKIAGKYLLLTEPSEPLGKRKEVARVLLDCSSNSAEVARLTAECKNLSREDIERICEEWQRAGA